jgi:iron(III) transport system substrate-binding protein
VAKPLYGTTMSHLAALTLEVGEEKAFALFRSWRANGLNLAQSNGDVEERVAKGEADVGLTDSDDAFSAMDRQKPVNFRVLDQTADWHGSFLVPNTVAMLKNCPHPAEAKAFIDYLLRPETEKWLAEHGARQIPVRDVGAKLAPPLDSTTLKPVRIDAQRLSEHVLQLGEKINQILSSEPK